MVPNTMNISLNGKWRYKIDPNNVGLDSNWWDPEEWITKNYIYLKECNIPSSWNQYKGLEKYEGIVWYFLEFSDIQGYSSTKDLFLRFNASNYYTKIWVDALELGDNEGGFLPFELLIPSGTLELEKKHYIAVRVENYRKSDRVPGVSFDWYNYGGMYRDVEFVLKEKLRIDWVGIKSKLNNDNSATLKVNLEIMDNRTEKVPDSEFNGEFSWNCYFLGNLSQYSKKQEKIEDKESEEDKYFKPKFGTSASTKIETDLIDDLLSSELSDEVLPPETIEPVIEPSLEGVLIKSGTYTIPKGKKKGVFEFNIEEPHLWHPNSPDLYQLEMILNESKDKKNIRFGIREIKTDRNYVFLNKKRILIKGVSLHEELVPYGRTIPISERRKDIINIKKLKLNAIRTAHYSHDESFYKLADEEGVLVFEEIPVYWDLDYKKLKTFQIAKKMIFTMIRRDFNHPSIILWSCGNEIPIDASISCLNFISNLGKYARYLDDSRLISWVSLPSLTRIPKKVKNYTDIYNINAYFGWYYLSPYNLNMVLDAIHYGNIKKPLLLSEFGADAKCGYRVPLKKFEKSSEERQASVISHQIKVLNSKDYVAGWFIWIYRDFKSHMRLNEYQRGFNIKGLVTPKNEKKLIAKWLPRLVNDKFSSNQIHHYKLTAALFFFGGWPVFKLINVISSLITKLAGRHNGGDKYYIKVPEDFKEEDKK